VDAIALFFDDSLYTKEIGGGGVIHCTLVNIDLIIFATEGGRGRERSGKRWRERERAGEGDEQTVLHRSKEPQDHFHKSRYCPCPSPQRSPHKI
jgi:hypothetical protein